MPEFMMIMRGQGSEEGWDHYVEKLIKTNHFRGGSAVGKGRCFNVKEVNPSCVVTGFMRFEADSIETLEELVSDNPTYLSGGYVEILELVVS